MTPPTDGPGARARRSARHAAGDLAAAAALLVVAIVLATYAVESWRGATHSWPFALGLVWLAAMCVWAALLLVDLRDAPAPGTVQLHADAADPRFPDYHVRAWTQDGQVVAVDAKPAPPPIVPRPPRDPRYDGVPPRPMRTPRPMRDSARDSMRDPMREQPRYEP